MEFLLPLFGRFHPLFVHLPIGILFFAVLLIFISGKEKNSFKGVIPIAFLVGTCFALLSGISGFLQYRYEGYSWETVQIHLILGWSTIAISAWLYFQFRKQPEIDNRLRVQSAGLLLLLMATGHFGGNITHGDDYLIEVLPPGLKASLGLEFEESKPLQLPEDNWEELAFYEGAIQPILNHNCTSCHNPRNRKGELDLTTAKGLLSGGENGEVLVHGNLTNSALFARLVLPKEDEDHMPPKEKRQPKKEEIELIKTWIEGGASMEKTLGEAKVPSSLVSAFFEREEIPFYPETTLGKVSEDSISKIRERGFFIENISLASPLFRVSCLNFPDFQDQDWSYLDRISSHITYLDLSETKASSKILESLQTLENLTILKLNSLPLSGENLELLINNQNLKIIYLNSSNISIENLRLLDGHPSLEKVYAFKTPASSQEKVKLSFELETGDFMLPKLATDTIVY
ncbi:c-type cytochrome domain-containing protein [Algoriphagus namhaensis]|uniref:C-type cytochrome domain-containing protein n=1 Tax=Algoriphagus namhaensis TaxID=915353 RepID=A0ABV8ASB2_9BACT